MKLHWEKYYGDNYARLLDEDGVRYASLTKKPYGWILDVIPDIIHGMGTIRVDSIDEAIYEATTHIRKRCKSVMIYADSIRCNLEPIYDEISAEKS